MLVATVYEGSRSTRTVRPACLSACPSSSCRTAWRCDAPSDANARYVGVIHGDMPIVISLRISRGARAGSHPNQGLQGTVVFYLVVLFVYSGVRSLVRNALRPYFDKNKIDSAPRATHTTFTDETVLSAVDISTHVCLYTRITHCSSRDMVHATCHGENMLRG